MSVKADVLARFSGDADARPLYLPDLTLWYEWHGGRGTLPEAWKGNSLPQVARAMGVAIWWVARPWRVETPGVEIITTEQGGERVVRAETSAGTLTARWTLGPDDDWWQTEYPVKSEDDLPAALELVDARSYVLDASGLAEMEAMVGEDGILALEIPRRPYSDLLHEFLGWSEGLVLLRKPAVREINGILEIKLQRLVQEIAELSGEIVFSPDNWNGQYVSPKAFDAYLSDSYRRTVKILHGHGKRLVVHIGGPIGRMLAPLAETGIDGIEGVAGPPQSDVSLTEARGLVGPEIVLWGGVAQDFLMSNRERPEFEAAVSQATREVEGDCRMILGVADRMPVEAELDRLQAIPALVEQALKNRRGR